MAVGFFLSEVMNHLRIPFQEHSHPPVYGASHLAHAEHVSGHRVAKTVILTDGSSPVAVVLRAADRVDVSRVRSVLGNDELRFATEEEIANWFRACEMGSVPPLPIRRDFRILMDRALATVGNILFAAGSAEVAVSVSFRDWYRAVRPGVGRFTATTNGFHHKKPAPVLVVEDEVDTNDLLCRLLEREGIECCGAEHGTRALDLAAQVPPAAILLDLMLPDMNGFDVYERLRRTGPLKRIPTIVVTALNDAESRRRSEELGADAFLTKPFLPEQLLAEVEGALADAKG
jgi:CheY-like chemotaxis protein/prolyl-tRNA editing enzyme YbaK/EbsC (Cys-tRNA(Pro) deacylase)